MGISSYIIRINYIAKTDSKGTLSYFLYNGHGDVVQTTDEAGTVQNQYDYDIWGNPTLTVETTENSIRYAGEYLDNETGLYYLRARYYDPATSRMLTEDSYCGEDRNPLSLNRYTYCFNDPIQYFDPSGHSPLVSNKMFEDAVASIKAKEAAEKAALSNKTVSTWSADTKKATFTTNGITQTMYVEKDGNAYNSDGNVVGKLEYGHITVTDSMYNALFGSGSGGTSNVTIDVRKGDHVTSVTTPDGSNVTVNNRSIIDTINTGKSSSLLLYNYGEIKSVNIGEGSTALINNSGSIGTITAGKISDKKDNKGMNIINSGFIGEMHTGENSNNDVTNTDTGYIGRVDTGLNNDTYIRDAGYITSAGGKGKIVYTINGIKVPFDIYKKAEKQARELLNKILDVYYQYEWPEGFSIGDKTWSADYNRSYLRELDNANRIASVFNTLDLAEDIDRTFKELSNPNNTNVRNPYVIAVSSVLVGIWRYHADEEPGISKLPDALGISGWVTKNIAEAKEKLDFVNDSDYRYLVYDDGFLFSANPRKRFIEEIEVKQNEIRKTPPLIYNTDEKNEAYKQSMLYYLEKVQQMNKYYNKNKAIMDEFIDRIAEKYD